MPVVLGGRIFASRRGEARVATGGVGRDPVRMSAGESGCVADRWRERVRVLHEQVRARLREVMVEQGPEAARAVRDEDPDGDTIYAIDVAAEELLLEACASWADEGASFVLVAEGLDGPRTFGSGAPTERVIVDPIDGTRGLMFDKRSAWCLTGVAPDLGDATRLSDIAFAAMTELPTTRQNLVEELSAVRGGGVRRTRRDLVTGRTEELTVRPSGATTLRHGFATVCAFFQGGKELLARFEEDFLGRALGGWRADKADVYTDQYISSAGQLAELALGRDRLVVDVRPQVHAAIGHPDSTLCSRPYDLCTALVAEEAGVIVRAPDGSALDAPLDTTTNCGFVAYANAQLHKQLERLLLDALRQHGLLQPTG